MDVMMFAPVFGQHGQTHIHCKRYIRLLQLAKCNVTFVEHRAVSRPEIPNVRYRRYPRRFSRLEGVVGSRATLGLHKLGLRWLRRVIPSDIYHAHWVDEQLWDLVAAGMRPIVATVWGTDLRTAAAAAASDPLRQKVTAALDQIDLLIVDSDDMTALAEALVGRKLRTKLLPIGIDTRAFRPEQNAERQRWRRQLNIEDHAKVAISARQLGGNYRQDQIIRAFSALKADLLQKSYLILRTFGHGFGTNLAELHELSEVLGISDRIRWVGDLEYDRLPGLYAACDLAINWPKEDAFPVTFLECFSSGIPVVSNRLPAYESNGALPLLICAPEETTSALAAEIESAFEDPGRMQMIAARARAFALNNYDERLTADALKEAYSEVLSIGPSAERSSKRTPQSAWSSPSS